MTEVTLNHEFLMSSIWHNLACVYGEPSKSDTTQPTELQDTAVTLLKGAVQQAQRTGVAAQELQLIGVESAFPESMKRREDFLELINSLQP